MPPLPDVYTTPEQSSTFANIELVYTLGGYLTIDQVQVSAYSLLDLSTAFATIVLAPMAYSVRLWLEK